MSSSEKQDKEVSEEKAPGTVRDVLELGPVKYPGHFTETWKERNDREEAAAKARLTPVNFSNIDFPLRAKMDEWDKILVGKTFKELHWNDSGSLYSFTLDNGRVIVVDEHGLFGTETTVEEGLDTLKHEIRIGQELLLKDCSIDQTKKIEDRLKYLLEELRRAAPGSKGCEIPTEKMGELCGAAEGVKLTSEDCCEVLHAEK
jgi:hypothetical protein